MIIATIDNPFTGERKELNEVEFNSYMSQTNGAVLEWIIKPDVQKHGSHDQSTHNPHKGGRGALAGGTRYEPEEIKDIYANAKVEMTSEESAAIQEYVTQGSNLNGSMRRGELSAPFTDKKTVAQTAIQLDSAMYSAPPMKDMAVWRVANIRSVEGLKVGDVVRDKGYASTTIADLTKGENGMMLLQLNSVSSGRKTLLEINTGEIGRGLFMPALGTSATVEFEKEFLIARDSLMEYLGARQMPLSSGSSMAIHQFKVVG